MKNLKYLSASEIARLLAEETGLLDEQVRKLLQAQADLACRLSRQGFQIPGLGVLVAVDRPQREMIVNFGPNAGQRMTQPAKTVLKFRIADAATAAVTGEKPLPTDVFNLELFEDGNLDVL